MNHLIIIGHPDKNSFCYNGIFKKIKEEMSKNNQTYKIIDLYSDDFTRPREKLIDNYIIIRQSILYKPRTSSITHHDISMRKCVINNFNFLFIF